MAFRLTSRMNSIVRWTGDHVHSFYSLRYHCPFFGRLSGSFRWENHGILGSFSIVEIRSVGRWHCMRVLDICAVHFVILHLSDNNGDSSPLIFLMSNKGKLLLTSDSIFSGCEAPYGEDCHCLRQPSV